MSATEYNPCQKCGMPLLPTQPNKCSECGWPATTVHGTGSGEAKDWFESMPSLSDVPTPPASPMVTQAREKLEEAMRYSGDRWEEWGERALHVAELLDDALALLRAAEKK